MTPEQVQLVKLSFMPVMMRKLDAGRIFYQRFFEIAPDTRPMFKTDVDSQSEKLMNMLGMIISSLHDAPNLNAMLEGLGRRHGAYGVRDEHYALVRSALLSTLEKILGDGFTDQTKAAWCELYDTVAAIMRGAPAQANSPSRPARRVANQ